MDRLNAYLQIVPLPVLVGALFGAIIVFAAIPSQLRLRLSLIAMPVWLSLGRFEDLGVIQAIAKATSVLCFVVVALSAVIDPGPKRKVHPVAWLYVLLAFASIFFVVSTEDRVFAMVIRLQLTTMMVAAVLVARTVVDQRTLVRVLSSLAIGLAIAIFIAGTALALNPGGAFAKGLGRFAPWGANQNQIGPVFLLGVPLLVYFGMKDNNPLSKLLLLGFGAAGVLLGFMTASRSVIFPMAGLLAVIGWQNKSRPIAIIAAAIAAGGVLYLVGSNLGEVKTDRLANLESDRAEIFVDYIGQIAERPVLGLLGTSGLSTGGDEVGSHAHNAYLQNLYWYGFALGGPYLLLAVITCFAALKNWLRRKRIACDPELVTLMFFLTGTVYLHGMVTSVVYYPTYTWAFFHVWLSVIVITWAASPGEELPLEGVTYDDDGWDEYDEYADYGEDVPEGDQPEQGHREPIPA